MANYRLADVFRLIREAKCPYCGDTDAYVGLNKVECPTCGGNPANKKGKAAAPTHGPAQSAAKQRQVVAQVRQQVDAFYRAPKHQRGWDHFSPDQGSFETYIGQQLDKFFGPGWSKDIDSAWGPGTTKRMLGDL